MLSSCGLNNVRHKGILDVMVKSDLITRDEVSWGKKTIIKYKASEKGKTILKELLEPYDEMREQVYSTFRKISRAAAQEEREKLHSQYANPWR